MKPNPTRATIAGDVELSNGHAYSTWSWQLIQSGLLLTQDLRFPLGAKGPSSADETWDSSAPGETNQTTMLSAYQIERHPAAAVETASPPQKAVLDEEQTALVKEAASPQTANAQRPVVGRTLTNDPHPIDH